MYDVVVIGGAAAGLSASLYTSRQAMKTLVVTKDIGGQALLTPHIENYPGFIKIGGMELMVKFEKQARHFGAEFVYEEVRELGEINDGFLIKTDDGVYESLSIILAFGKTPRDLGVPGEARLKGRGVSYCAICDARLFKDRRVIVVGAGETAIEATIMLCPLAERVYLCYQGSKIIGHEELNQKCMNRNVETIANSKLLEIKGKNNVETVVLQDVKTQKTEELEVEGVFVEMGYTIKTDFVKGLVSLNEAGEVIVDRKCATSRRGVFAAGDVTDIPFKQVVVSAGEGAKAGLSAYNYVQTLRGKRTIKSDWKEMVANAQPEDN